jgi:hypothetical protein
MSQQGVLVDFEIPEGSMVTCVMSIAQWIGPDGETHFTMATMGQAPTTTKLGMIERVKYKFQKQLDEEEGG